VKFFSKRRSEKVKSKGERTGAMYLLTDYGDYMKDKAEDYKVSNKTSEALKELQTQDYDMITIIYTIVKHQLRQVSSRLHEDFNKKVYEGNKFR